MEEKELRVFILDVMKRAKDVYVTTIDENDLPQIRVMFNLRNIERFPKAAKYIAKEDDRLLVYLSTNTSSEKINQISNNATGAVYFCIPEEFRGVMCQGYFEIINDLGVKEEIWTEGWERYYPTGKPTDPDFTILRLEPIYVKAYYQLATHVINLRG